MANETGKGGRREGAGRKKKWKAPGETEAVRIPKLLEGVFIECAKELDELLYGDNPEKEISEEEKKEKLKALLREKLQQTYNPN